VKAHPNPGDSPAQDVERDRLDIDQIPGGDFAHLGLHGAIPTPQLPITTEVTPCHEDEEMRGSQQIWAS
jgi:hypothetical protein